MKTLFHLIQSINTFPPCGIKWVLCLMISQVLSITACSMLNLADAITNIELAGKWKEYSFHNSLVQLCST